MRLKIPKSTHYSLLPTHYKVGQALVTLLVFIAVATTITAAATTVTLINSQTTGKFAQGEAALTIAHAGADNAVLRLLRDPNYSGETDLSIGNGTATITVSGSSVKTITAEGKDGNFIRKIQVVGTFVNNTFTVSSWDLVD